MSSRYDRRSLLKSGMAVGGVLIAGCLGDATGGTGDPGTTNLPADTPIRQTEFQGTDLVIHLRENHDVTRLNLIDPDGSLFSGAAVAIGATTARIQLLDIRPGLGGYEHYEPGSYELVAVREAGSRSIDVDLRPELRVVDVQQYRDGDRPSDLGKLAVTVENVGSGPTWVFHIEYRGSPNESANRVLSLDPGNPQIDFPSHLSNLYLLPGESSTYVGVLGPNLFTANGGAECTGSPLYSLIVRSADGKGTGVEIQSTFAGEVQEVGMFEDYTCSLIDVDLRGASSTSNLSEVT